MVFLITQLEEQRHANKRLGKADGTARSICLDVFVIFENQREACVSICSNTSLIKKTRSHLLLYVHTHRNICTIFRIKAFSVLLLLCIILFLSYTALALGFVFYIHITYIHYKPCRYCSIYVFVKQLHCSCHIFFSPP